MISSLMILALLANGVTLMSMKGDSTSYNTISPESEVPNYGFNAVGVLGGGAD
jgi:hypothetical protein